MRVILFTCVTVAVALATPTTSAAYLDPASGSILLQVLLGGVAGLGLMVKMFWHRVQGLVRPGKDPEHGPRG